MVQLSYPYFTTRKTIALTRWTFDGKVVSLLLNMLSRLVTVFLPRSKHLLIPWLQLPSAVVLKPPEIKPLTACITTNWKILWQMGIPDHFTCLLKNLYPGQEATARTRHVTMDWFQIGKGVCQGCNWLPACLTYMQSTSCKIHPWMELRGGP